MLIRLPHVGRRRSSNADKVRAAEGVCDKAEHLDGGNRSLVVTATRVRERPLQTRPQRCRGIDPGDNFGRVEERFDPHYGVEGLLVGEGNRRVGDPLTSGLGPVEEASEPRIVEGAQGASKVTSERRRWRHRARVGPMLPTGRPVDAATSA